MKSKLYVYNLEIEVLTNKFEFLAYFGKIL